MLNDTTASVRTTYLAIARHYWGRGKTPAAARAAMRKAGASGPSLALYQVDDDGQGELPQVDELGRIVARRGARVAKV